MTDPADRDHDLWSDQLSGAGDSGARLGPADAAVVDALADAGWDLRALAGLDDRQMEVARRLMARLTEVGSPLLEGRSDRAVEAVLARVAGEPGAVVTAGGSVELTGADEDALEALIAAGFEPRRVASGMRQRAEAQARLLSNLESEGEPVSAADREAAVARTLAFVERGAAQQRLRMTIVPERVERRRGRFQLADLVTAAAVLLVAGSVVVPVVSQSRAIGRQSATMANLGAVGAALAQYSATTDATARGSLVPLAYEPTPSQVWWNVGTPRQSNTEHFYLLVRQGFITLAQMAAPTNEQAVVEPQDGWTDWPSFESVSYSYRNVFGPPRTRCPKTTDERTIMAADRSPVVVRARRGERVINVLENSLAHGGRGQAVLHFGGSVVFMRTPLTDRGDNIWIPRCLEATLRAQAGVGSPPTPPGGCNPLHGTETPGCVTDNFVCP